MAFIRVAQDLLGAVIGAQPMFNLRVHPEGVVVPFLAVAAHRRLGAPLDTVQLDTAASLAPAATERAAAAAVAVALLAVARPAAVVGAAEQAGHVARGDGLEGRDRRGQDPHVDLDDGPVHGRRDDPRRVGVDEHPRNEGDANDRRDAGTVWIIREPLVSTHTHKSFPCVKKGFEGDKVRMQLEKYSQ